jgi:AraC-like DNA-binding protein
MRQLSVREYGAIHASHSHEHAQVLVGLEGELELEIEGRGARVATGDGLLVAPGERHAFEARAGSRCLVLDTDDESWLRCPTTPARRDEVAALGHWLALASQRRGGAPANSAALLLSAWQPAAATGVRIRRDIDWAALSDWLGPRLHEPLTVADLAARAHLGTSQFSDRCAEANGVTAMAWLRTQRLQRARALRAAGASVAEAARRCGYRSPSALTAAMKRSSLDD